MNETLRLRGELRKASTDEQGQPHFEVLVTGPRHDRVDEMIAQEAQDKVIALAKAGRLPLVPSHDVPIPLSKSVDASVSETGDILVDYLADPGDRLTMGLHKAIAEDGWRVDVSLGSPRCIRKGVFDPTLKKAVTKVVDFDDVGAHVALAFPGKGLYPGAGITAALFKAETAKDPAELSARGWPDAALEKAMKDGIYVPPTFAERHASKKLGDELPGMLDTLRYTVEDIVAPWAGLSQTVDRRALLRQTFAEFEAAVFAEAVEAGLAKAEGEATPPSLPAAPAIAPEPPVAAVPLAGTAVDVAGEIRKALGAADVAASLAKAMGVTDALETLHKAVNGTVLTSLADMQGLVKSLTDRVAAIERPAPPRPIPDTQPARAPHTGVALEKAGQVASDETVAALEKAYRDESDPTRRADKARQLNLARLSRA